MSGGSKAYFQNIQDTVTSFWHGMSITLSHLFRRPVTVQYPDRTDVPVSHTLPPRYRGFLEVDMDTCTACQACERACPIACIAIEIEKDPANPRQRVMTRFDIDEAKCMYCGLCVEPCPTGAIQHTREFEGAMVNIQNLVFRFVDPARPVPPYKPPKGAETYPRKVLGEVVKPLIKQWDAPPPPFPPPADPGAAAGRTPEQIATALALALKEAPAADGPTRARLLESVQGGTDCAACSYPGCKAYAEALARGAETRPDLCEPGSQASHEATAKLLEAFKPRK